MIRYKTIDITTVSGANAFADALAGLGERKRMIRAIYPLIDLGAIGGDERVTVIKEQEEVLEIEVGMFTNLDTGGTIAYLDISRRIEINLPMEKGEGLKFGLEGAAGSSTHHIIMEYEDL